MIFKLGTFFNIPLYVHWSTILVATMFAISEPALFPMYILTLFFVALHEYGHSLMARHFDWEVQDITMYAVGGVASMRFSSDPKQEFAVAAAGPAVNFFFLAVFFGISLIVDYFQVKPLMLLTGLCMMANAIIPAFNLIPIFPMDGGRIIRSITSMFFGHYRATYLTVRYSQMGGIILSVLAFCYGWVFPGIIFLIAALLAQVELNNAKTVEVLDSIRKKLASHLGRPELKDAGVTELIYVLEEMDAKRRSELGLQEDTLTILNKIRVDIGISR